jgi:hypothetical protein
MRGLRGRGMVVVRGEGLGGEEWRVECWGCGGCGEWMGVIVAGCCVGLTEAGGCIGLDVAAGWMAGFRCCCIGVLVRVVGTARAGEPASDWLVVLRGWTVACESVASDMGVVSGVFGGDCTGGEVR